MKDLMLYKALRLGPTGRGQGSDSHGRIEWTRNPAVQVALWL